MKQIQFVVMMLLIASFLVFPAFAEEGGSGHYLPGQMASFIDAPPNKPGFAIINAFGAYSGKAGAGKQLPIIGDVASNLDATVYADSIGLMYTIKPKLLGGNYAMIVALPFGQVNVEGDLITAAGTAHRSQSAGGLFDMYFSPFVLSWKKKDLNIGGIMGFYAPTGKYDKANIANLGKNYWTAEPNFFVSYLSSKMGLELSAYTAFDFNSTNTATDYKTGNQWHLDATIAQHLPLKKIGIIGIGANTWHYKQITGDSGTGAKLGSFEGRSSGIGPTLSFIKQTKTVLVAAEVKWLPELSVEKRLEGDFVWAKLALVF